MDRDQIKSQRFVERYLSGDLLVREAREFEQFCREHPDVLDTLPIPARIKSQLRVKSFDGMDTSIIKVQADDLNELAAVTGLQAVKPGADNKTASDDDEDDVEPQRSGTNKLLLLLLVAALCGVGGLFWQTQTQQQQIRSLTVAAKSLRLRAASEIRSLKLTPTNTQSSQPQASVSLSQAQWLDIYLNVKSSRYKSFQLTVEKVDEDVRLMQIKRIAPDSNKQLRFSLNSAAYNAGQYEIKLEGIDYRGQTHTDGWVLIAMQ